MKAITVVAALLVAIGCQIWVESASAVTGHNEKKRLSLLVEDCDSGIIVAGADLSATLIRDGGVIAQYSGVTDAQGEYDFVFGGVGEGDRVQITITPQSRTADSGHLFELSGDNEWEVVVGPTFSTVCTDECLGDLAHCQYSSP